MPKESGKVRYAYGVAMSLLLGGTAFSLATGRAGAQVAQNSPAAIAPQGAPMSFADLTARLQPAVVNISTKQRVPVRNQVADPFEEFFRRFDPNQQGQGQRQGQGQGQPAPGGGGVPPRTRETGSLGSGFIISPDGYVVTNNHLIQGAGGNGTVDSVTVTMTNGKEYPARIVGRDSTSDLALLKIEGNNLPYVNWGDSTKSRVGDWILAIGNPYGLGGTVTAGIISALHRGITGVGPYDRYIQTDASINMGNCGRPDVRSQRQCHRRQFGADQPDRRLGRDRPLHPCRTRQAGDRFAAQGSAPAARLSRCRPPTARREHRALARPTQGHGRDRPLGRPRRPRRQGRTAARRRHPASQRPDRDPRGDRLLPYRQHPGRIARGGRDRSRRPAPDAQHRRRPAPDRRGTGAARRRRRRQRPGANDNGPATPQRALGLGLSAITPEIIRADQLARDRSRRGHHRRSIPTATRPRRASSAATSSSRSTSNW